MSEIIPSNGNLPMASLSQIGYEGDLGAKIEAANLVTDPYPYFVVTDLFPEADLASFDAYWPAFDFFQPDVPKNYTCKILSFAEELPFWRDYMLGRGRSIANAMAAKFAPWIAARYGADIRLEAQFAGLMQSESDYTGHSCHTHHYHNPNWVGTALIYLDSDATGHPGTMIYRSDAPDLESDARLAANTLHWLGDPNITEVMEVGYERNKMFAFFDSPVSYHGVKSSTNGHGNRRIMRFHLGVDNDWLLHRYGCDIAEYRRKRMEERDSEEVFAWMMRDITEFRATTR